MYPYEKMGSFKIFVLRFLIKNYLISVIFFSSLKDECISEKYYPHSFNILNVFRMNTICDYYDFYLKTEVLLLAVAFVRFINTWLKYYGLDPCHYFSSPGLGWDVMLKMTEIELVSDTEIYLFVEKRMRGVRYLLQCYKI